MTENAPQDMLAETVIAAFEDAQLQITDLATRLNSVQALLGMAIKQKGSPLEVTLSEARDFCEQYVLKVDHMAETDSLRLSILPIHEISELSH